MSTFSDDRRDEDDNFRIVEINKQDDELKPRRKQEETVKLCQDSNEIIGTADESNDTPQRGRHKKTIKNPHGRKGKQKLIIDKIEKNISLDETEMEANLLKVTESENKEEALSSLQSLFWKQVVTGEFESLQKKKT